MRLWLVAALLLATTAPAFGQATSTFNGRVLDESDLVLPGVTFQTGSATLTVASLGTLDQVAASLRAYPDVRVEIAGYTDDQGALAANRRLSQARADAVRAYLIRRGVPGTQLVARGFGSANPLDSNSTPTGRARNRRVELHRQS